MPSEIALVDTNVLVYAVYEDSPQHAPSRRLLESCQRGEQPLCVASQNLVEFHATVTSSRRVTFPFTPADGLRLVRQILTIAHMLVLPSPPDLHERWFALMSQAPVGGKKGFDVQLAAIMLANGVRRVFTYNTSDFKSERGLEAVEP